MLDGTRVLLVITGGIAAYKALDLIRRLRERGVAVRCILTESATHLVTPLSVAALSEDRVYTDLFSLTDESEMGHIRLSREANLVVVAPATANILAKMAAGIADDLATTALLATDKSILVAPAMNVVMWRHPATRSNVGTLRSRGVHFVGPETGDLACGETGRGRMSEPETIADTVCAALDGGDRPLAGRRTLVTSGPTHEPIDPVRYLGNRSSGKQGHAIAAAFAALGADTTLVSGPTDLEDPAGVTVHRVETAQQMQDACDAALPVDVAVCAAAVADWRVAAASTHKIKKGGDGPPMLALAENPDILANLANLGDRRPQLLIGFAAETESVEANAVKKRKKKGCDWIVANDVSTGTGTFGGDDNEVLLITDGGRERWPRMSKAEVAVRLAYRIAEELAAAATAPVG